MAGRYSNSLGFFSLVCVSYDQHGTVNEPFRPLSWWHRGGRFIGFTHFSDDFLQRFHLADFFHRTAKAGSV